MATAKKWLVADAWRAMYQQNSQAERMEARQDIARRFPLFGSSTADEVLAALDKVTVQQAESAMRRLYIAQGALLEDETEKAPAAKPRKKKAAAATSPKKKPVVRAKRKPVPEPEPEPEPEPVVDEDVDELDDDDWFADDDDDDDDEDDWDWNDDDE